MCLVGRLPTFDMPEERWEAWWTPGNKDDKASSSAPGWDSVCILGLCTTGSPSRCSVEEEEKYRQMYLVRTEKEKAAKRVKKTTISTRQNRTKICSSRHLVAETGVCILLRSPFCSDQLFWCVDFNVGNVYMDMSYFLCYVNLSHI